MMPRMQLLPLEGALLDPGLGVHSMSQPPWPGVLTQLTASCVCAFKETPVLCSAQQAGRPQSGRCAGPGSQGWGQAFWWAALAGLQAEL